MKLTVYHNPACSKSRKTLEIIRGHGLEPRIVEYLKSPPDSATILAIADHLEVAVKDLIRTGETDWSAGIKEGSVPVDDEGALAEWLARHPKVLQRPIVVDEERNVAIIGRPPEAVLGMLSDPVAESSAGS